MPPKKPGRPVKGLGLTPTKMRLMGWASALAHAEAGRPRELADLIASGQAPPDADVAKQLADFIRGTAQSSKDTPLSHEAIFVIRDRFRSFSAIREDLLKRAASRDATPAERKQLRAEASDFTVTKFFAELEGHCVLDVHGRPVRLTRARVRDIVYGRS